MRLYIKGDYTKEIPFDYMELAKRMWFEKKDGIEPDLSYAGYLDLPIDKLSIHLEFKTKHADLLNLTYDEAVDISLEELEVMEAIDEPLWDELHRGWEEYIKIHGERVYDDEEDE